MKLAHRLTVATVAGMCTVIAVQVYLRVEREASRFSEETRRYQTALGQTLGSAVAAEWSDGGEARARALLERANAGLAEVQIRWVWPEASAPAVDAPHRPVTVGHVEAGGMFRTYVPVELTGGRVGAIEIEESTARHRAYLRATIWRTLGFTTAGMALATLIAATLGAWLVGRPMRALVEKARRVGRGDLSGPLELAQTDEIGELAAEMNMMCERLAAANQQIEIESSARLETVEQLRHADRLMTVGKLASGVAHELGTPLNIVSGRARMIATGEVVGAEVGQCAEIILEQSNRMVASIRQLLDLARRRSPQRTEEDLRQIAARTLSLLLPMAADADVTLELEAGERPLRAYVDPTQIQQALANLVVNGIHAMPPGGRLTVSLGSGPVAAPPSPAEPGEFATLAVEDEGHGITEADRAHLFEPFFTTKEAGQGTGLGLSVANGIVREHGGWISVASDLGSGSVFALHLPLLAAAAEA